MLYFRQASSGDIDLLRHWDNQPHVIASDPDSDWQWEKELGTTHTWREQLIAEENGRAIGFLQIIDPSKEPSRYWGQMPAGYRAIDIWIGEEKDLGKGYGTQMIKLALKQIFNDNTVVAVLIDPLATNLRAHKFYRRLNFKFVEERRFGEDHCFVFQLNRWDWENSNLYPNS